MILLGAGTCAATPERALQLKQTHYLFGEFVLTLAKDAVRIENKGRFKFIVTSKAPDWQVYIFRNDDRTYFTESLKEFAETGLVSEFVLSKRDQWTEQSKISCKPTRYFGRCAILAQRKNHMLIYLPLQNISAPQAEKVVYAAHKLPTGGGIPLVFSENGDRIDFIVGGKMGYSRQIYLTTQAITAVDAAPSMFVMPKSFSLVKSVREVVAGSDIRKESRDAQDLFETGKHENKNEKQE